MDNSFYILATDSIKTALQKINNNSKGAVLVVADHGALQGILTDGDLRRALLGSLSMADSVCHIDGCDQVVSVIDGCRHLDILGQMDSADINQIAVVSDTGIALDLLHRRDVTPVLLSTPHMGSQELEYVAQAFETNWIAPLGPNVDGFEDEICQYTGAKYAAALSSGTAAIHLSLLVLGVERDDIVFCSSFTFVASANPIMYIGATPVFIDSEPDTWNMCPASLDKALQAYNLKNKLPKAIVLVNLYGQPAKMDELLAVADKYGVPIIEDSAESLGATYKQKASGTFGRLGIFSFNGNKIITTSGGGMVVSDDKFLIKKIKYLSTQARDQAPYYYHSEVGYNYRMSNILAGIGRGQLHVLDERVMSRRSIFDRYHEALKEYEALVFMPEMSSTYSNRWLSCATLDPEKTTLTPKDIIAKLSLQGIEARHTWNPMHRQPLFEGCDFVTAGEHAYADYLFEYGLCLPSGSNLSDASLLRVIKQIKGALCEII